MHFYEYVGATQETCTHRKVLIAKMGLVHEETGKVESSHTTDTTEMSLLGIIKKRGKG